MTNAGPSRVVWLTVAALLLVVPLAVMAWLDGSTTRTAAGDSPASAPTAARAPELEPIARPAAGGPRTELPSPPPAVEAGRAAPLRPAAAADLGGQLPITIVDPWGEPVPHGRVRWAQALPTAVEGAFTPGRWHDLSPPFHVGRRAPDDPAARAFLIASTQGPGWGQVAHSLTPADHRRTELRFVLGSDAVAWGRVVDGADAPLVGLEVALAFADGNRVEVTSGSEGRFPLPWATAGVVGAESLGPVQTHALWDDIPQPAGLLRGDDVFGPVQLGALELRSIDPLLLVCDRAARVAVRVLRGDGAPVVVKPGRGVEPVELAVALADGRKLGPLELTLDGQGRALVSLGVRGPAQLVARRGSLASAPVPVELRAGERAGPVDLVLEDHPRLAGRVIDEQGRPVGGAWVACVDRVGTLHELWWPVKVDWRQGAPTPPGPSTRHPTPIPLAVTAADGRFELPFASGVMVVQHPAFAMVQQEVRVPQRDLELVLPPGNALVVEVPDHALIGDGAPLAVRVAGLPLKPFVSLASQTFALGGDGTCVVSGLIRQRYDVELLAGDAVLATATRRFQADSGEVERVVLDPGEHAQVTLDVVGDGAQGRDLALAPADPSHGRPVRCTPRDEGRWYASVPWVGETRVLLVQRVNGLVNKLAPDEGVDVAAIELPAGPSTHRVELLGAVLVVQVDVSPEAWPVAVKVRDASGTELAHVGVDGRDMTVRIPGLPMHQELVLDAIGSGRLLDAPASLPGLRTSEWLAQARVRLDASGETRLLLRAAPPVLRDLELIAVDALGQPLAGVVAWATLPGMNLAAPAPSAADGRLSVPIPDGLRAELRLGAPAPASQSAEVVLQGDESSPLKLRLLRLSGYWFRVRCPGVELAGARLRATPLDPASGIRPVSRPLTAAGESERYELARGRFELTLEAADGQQRRVELALGPPSRLPQEVVFP